MKRFLIVTPFLLLACSLTQPSTLPLPPMTSTPAATATRVSITRTATPGACTVSTGPEDGRLNLRIGAGMSYRVLDVLHEGDALTVLAPGTWSRVRSADGVIGFVNSNYLECEG